MEKLPFEHEETLNRTGLVLWGHLLMASKVSGKKKHITAMGTLSPAVALSAVLVSHKRE